MNTSIFLLGLIISVVYLIYKFIEMRFIFKQAKPIKELVRESLIVYICCVAGLFINNQINHKSMISVPKVFTNAPNF